MIVAQVTATELKTHQELRYTTAASAVIQLMGSDEQFSLVEFPIVLAYNRIHHYLPTAYLSDRSLANWRLAQMYKHFTAASRGYPGTYGCKQRKDIVRYVETYNNI